MSTNDLFKYKQAVRLWITLQQWGPDHLCLVSAGSFVDSGKDQWWQLTPVNSERPTDGYLLSSGDQYISATMIPIPQRNSALALTTTIAEALRVIPYTDPNGQTFYLQQVGTNQCLTLDTRGTLGRLDPYQATNSVPIFQHFKLDTNIQDDTREYFWLGNGTGKVLQAAGSNLVLGIMTSADQQLWRQEGQAFISRLNGFALGATGNGVLLQPFQANLPSSQQWSVDPDNTLRNLSTNRVLQSSESSVVMSAKQSPVPQEQEWAGVPYYSTPPGRNEFANLGPGNLFCLCNAHDASSSNLTITVPLNAGAGTAVTINTMDDSKSSQQVWQYTDDMKIVNVASGLALGTIGTAAVGTLVGVVDSNNPLASAWIFSEGFILHKESQLVLTLDDSSTNVTLQVYDPLWPSTERWRLVLRELSNPMLLMIGDPPHPGLVINKLELIVEVSNDFWSGTSQRVYYSLDASSAIDYYLCDELVRGETYTFIINHPTHIQDLNYLSIHIDQRSTFSDEAKIKSILFRVNDTYTNYSLSNINTSIKKYWAGYIYWEAWRDPVNKPIDYSGRTYAVGYLPYLADIRSWRTYDPSTLDGVYILVGVRNNAIIVESLKNKTCTQLQPNRPNTSYTWVYTPDNDSIILTFYERDDSANYIRHSQLGSGNPVICAGEFLIKAGLPESFIAMVNDSSGHYKPDGGSCLRAVRQKLELLGLSTANTEWRWPVS